MGPQLYGQRSTLTDPLAIGVSMSTNRIVTGVAALVAAAGLIGTGAALSNAATTTPTSTSTSAASPNASGNANNDTPVTGTELTKVTAAVKAKDSAVAVPSVRMDPDGSYDVFGTKSGANLMLEVSKDLNSITTNTGGGGHNGGGHHGGGSNHTPVTGTELTKVTSAVKAKDSAVAVTSVRMDPDGSYDVFGTKSGANLMLEVSKDLNSITTNTGGGGHNGGGHHGGGGSNDTPVTGTELTKVTSAVKAKDSAVAVTSVRMDPDGSYDVFGTKSGANVMLEVSKDLKSITTNAGGQHG